MHPETGRNDSAAIGSMEYFAHKVFMTLEDRDLLSVVELVHMPGIGIVRVRSKATDRVTVLAENDIPCRAKDSSLVYESLIRICGVYCRRAQITVSNERIEAKIEAKLTDLSLELEKVGSTLEVLVGHLKWAEERTAQLERKLTNRRKHWRR